MKSLTCFCCARSPIGQTQVKFRGSLCFNPESRELTTKTILYAIRGKQQILWASGSREGVCVQSVGDTSICNTASSVQIIPLLQKSSFHFILSRLPKIFTSETHPQLLSSQPPYAKNVRERLQPPCNLKEKDVWVMGVRRPEFRNCLKTSSGFLFFFLEGWRKQKENR